MGSPPFCLRPLTLNSLGDLTTGKKIKPSHAAPEDGLEEGV